MELSFELSKKQVDCYDFTEVTARHPSPKYGNPFREVRVTADLSGPDGKTVKIQGFCDSEDGSLYKVRFMPRKSGEYSYAVFFCDTQGNTAETTGSFSARDSGRSGLLQSDPEYPYHFVWEGTGEHYFLNGTTAYYLMGFHDDGEIRRIIDRLEGYGINRLRVLLYGRQFDHPWRMPVVNTDTYSMTLNPWPAKFPRDITQPEFDLSRFNTRFWHRYEKMLEYCREKDIIVSVIFFIGGQQLPVPFAPSSENEYRYYRYGVSRLSAYSNITWDIGNEHDFHRDFPRWGNEIGNMINGIDPYDHITAGHNKFYLNTWGNWNGMQLFQHWDSGLNRLLIDARKKQEETGYIIPHVIEEYGYEDLWERFPGHRAADTRRRAAWEVYMAGAYQTNGETARTGTGESEDTGGGWVNGRGDDSMTMLEQFRCMIDFFTSFPWWRGSPGNGLILSYDPVNPEQVHYFNNDGNQALPLTAMCLREPGSFYALYLPAGGEVSVRLGEGKYNAREFDPRNGTFTELPDVRGDSWSSPRHEDNEDWAFILTKS